MRFSFFLSLKQQIKNTLQNLGLLDISRQLFKNTRSATPAILLKEFSNGNSHNGIPLPPPELRFLVIGTRWSEIFISSGKKIVDDMFLKLREAGIEPNSFKNILDFGCGCGRMIRHMTVLKSAKLFGCDYNSTFINWCKNNLNFAEFYKNELLPPLKYADNSMGFIYARSIFTHLDEETQKAWLTEFRRVLKTGGILYFTTHGEQFLEHLKNEEIDRMRKGELIVHLSQREGENFCASYQMPQFLKANLPGGFEFVHFFGGSREEHLRQDINIMRKL